MKTALVATLVVAALGALISLGVAGLIQVLFSVVRRTRSRGRSHG